MIRLCWRGPHTGPYGGCRGAGKSAQVRDFAAWRFEGGKVAEISTIQDQFAPLKQIGYLPEDGCAASPCPGGRGRTCAGGAAGPERDLVHLVARSARRVGRRPLWTAARHRYHRVLCLRWENPESPAQRTDARASRSNCVMRCPAGGHVPPGLKASRPGNASARVKRQLVSVMTGMLANDFIR